MLTGGVWRSAVFFLAGGCEFSSVGGFSSFLRLLLVNKNGFEHIQFSCLIMRYTPQKKVGFGCFGWYTTQLGVFVMAFDENKVPKHARVACSVWRIYRFQRLGGSISHSIHVWYIYLHLNLPYFTSKNNQM